MSQVGSEIVRWEMSYIPQSGLTVVFLLFPRKLRSSACRAINAATAFWGDRVDKEPSSRTRPSITPNPFSEDRGNSVGTDCNTIKRATNKTQTDRMVLGQRRYAATLTHSLTNLPPSLTRQPTSSSCIQPGRLSLSSFRGR